MVNGMICRREVNPKMSESLEEILPLEDITKAEVPNYRVEGQYTRQDSLYARYLYPKAALNMMTHATTALGVCGTSMYIHHPVNASAIPI